MKKIISTVICAMLIISSLGFGAFAVDDKTNSKPYVSVSTVSANPGDTVFVPITVSYNPGILYTAFSLNFDKSVLEYVNTHSDILNGYSVFDHSKNGRITVSAIESDERISDGTLVCVEFKVKEKASADEYKLSLNKTFFEDKDGKTVNFKIKNGTLKIEKSCSGEHTYSQWRNSFSQKCTTDGMSSRYCTVCGHADNKVEEATGHSLERTFTLDVIAKDGNIGMLSRHCKTCGAKTNIVTYTEENDAAAGINGIIEKLSENSITNLVYFLNGNVKYPDIYGEDFDPKEYTKSLDPAIDEDKTIHIDVIVDKITRRLFGNDKNSGIIGTIRRAAIAGEIPLKPLCWLIRIILI